MASRHLIENGGPWGTGWCCFGRGLAPCFRPTEDIKSVNTSGSSSHTPETWAIKRVHVVTQHAPHL